MGVEAMRRFKLKTWLGAAFLIAALLVRVGAALAQGSEPGQRMVPIGYCQLAAAALTSVVKLSSCVRASFTATAGANNTQLVVTVVTGILLVGDQIVSGTGLTAGTIITGQVSGTPGGAGTYQLSATNTASAASVTSGGIPPGATSAFLEAETAAIRYRDDGGAPTAAIGSLIVNGIPGILYTGTLGNLQFINNTGGSPLLDIAFYRQ
jgi:hypothetical protein